MVTVTGTENLLMAATLAGRYDDFENAAREPEVVDLARCLGAMGARISGAGSDRITVEGVASLHGATHAVMPDRIETGTFLAAVAAAGGAVAVRGVQADSLEAVLDKLREAGASIDASGDVMRVRRDGPLRPSICARRHPGFPTDMQAQFMALATRAQGVGRHRDNFREPDDARAGTEASGRRHRSGRQHGDRQGCCETHGSRRDGHGPARLPPAW
jgi:UDP-N-acetylglucosamine 1-carboxyvinyltransferase